MKLKDAFKTEDLSKEVGEIISKMQKESVLAVISMIDRKLAKEYVGNLRMDELERILANLRSKNIATVFDFLSFEVVVGLISKILKKEAKEIPVAYALTEMGGETTFRILKQLSEKEMIKIIKAMEIDNIAPLISRFETNDAKRILDALHPTTRGIVLSELDISLVKDILCV